MNALNMNNNLKIALWLSLAISVLVHFISSVNQIISIDSETIPAFPVFLNILLEHLITFIMCLAVFQINFQYLRPFTTDRWNRPVAVSVAVVASFFVFVIMSEVLFSIKDMLVIEAVDTKGEGFVLWVIDIFMTLVVIVSIYVLCIVQQNQQNRLEIQNLELENLQSQFDALKNQVSPHFLFNSLNSLKALIKQSPHSAQEYLTQLSQVLRYTLKANENNLVSLDKELAFLESYFHLIKLRFNKNIELKQKLDNKYLSYKIPPLSLQVLVENAVKHNEISSRKPLTIILKTNKNDTLIVKNNINKKFSPEAGAGVGLANLLNQYKILSDNEVSISRNGEYFSVELPLLQE